MKVMPYRRETQSFPIWVCISLKLQEMVRQEEGVLICPLPRLNQFFYIFLTTLGLCHCPLNCSGWDARSGLSCCRAQALGCAGFNSCSLWALGVWAQ